MRPRRLQDQVDLLPDGAGPEQEHHDQRVREPHLGSVDGAIAGALDDGEEVAVRGVEQDALDGGLFVDEHGQQSSVVAQHCIASK